MTYVRSAKAGISKSHWQNIIQRNTVPSLSRVGSAVCRRAQHASQRGMAEWRGVIEHHTSSGGVRVARQFAPRPALSATRSAPSFARYHRQTPRFSVRVNTFGWGRSRIVRRRESVGESSYRRAGQTGRLFARPLPGRKRINGGRGARKILSKQAPARFNRRLQRACKASKTFAVKTGIVA